MHLLKIEIYRKFFHFAGLIFFFIYLLLPNYALIIFFTLLFIDIVFENLRMHIPSVNNFLMKIFKSIHRENEVYKTSGLFWTFSGITLTTLLFNNPNIIKLAILTFVFADGLAGLIGILCGKKKIINNKTLEGSLTCFFVSFIVGLFFLSVFDSFIYAAVITLVEITNILNDNFLIPVVGGFCGYILL